FWPQFEDTDPDKDGSSHKVSWVGDVHALFMSPDGMMYEDTDQDAKLDTTADKRVVLYYSSNVNRTRGCYQALNASGVCPDDADFIETPCPVGGDGCVELLNVKFLWSANKQLRDMETRPSPKERKIFTWNDADNDGIVDDVEWFELKTNMNSTWETLNALAAETVTGPLPRGPVTRDFLTPEDWGIFVDDDGSGGNPANELIAADDYPPDPLGLDALDSMIDWLRGKDHLDEQDDAADGRIDKVLRSRMFSFSAAENAEWKLGDIIHSTPTVVSTPAEVYHYVYRDPTYKKFASKWANRRSVIYFGANDGMLHAMNGGFYNATTSQFCCSYVPDFDPTTGLANTDAGTCIEPVDGVCPGDRQLGDELWAYIPYNLQPHLKCLPNPSYRHKYYVDQKPRVFDVQIFKEEAACSSPGTAQYEKECIHPGGWGTILVGSMRFGGAPVEASTLNDLSADTRELSSAYFILDITNPEADPVLLGEMTRPTDQYVDLNYTTSTPGMVSMRGDDLIKGLISSWYLVMGSGPSELDSRNSSEGKLAVFPLDRLTGEVVNWEDGVPTNIHSNTEKSFRILDQEPGGSDDTGSPTEAGVFRVPGSAPASYISDMIQVDYDVELSAQDDLGSRYRTDAIYFGTTDGGSYAKYPDTYLDEFPDDFYYWNKGGRIFRLVTKVLDSNGQEVYSTPSMWKGAWSTPTADPSPIRMLLDAKMPIVSGPAIGFDGNSFWVYVGAGHFYSEKDKTDDGWCLDENDCHDGDDNTKISFFGIREPIKDNQSGFTGWQNPPSSITCKDAVMTWDTIGKSSFGATSPWDINGLTNQDVVHNGTPGQRGLMQTDNILVQEGTGYLACYDCSTGGNGIYTCTPQSDSVCFPGANDISEKGDIYDDSKGQYTFTNLK
ncbi:MAG: hypothetical protein D3910_08260, partial [Candidatus Electrothrix sp. ATG2]|nr:hypothetical protein [Candidatus Electrothrix sp. ATG2]